MDEAYKSTGFKPEQRGGSGGGGSVGPQGPAGPQGVQGPQGAMGPAGATGATGIPGAQGVPGPQGEKGDTGVSGVNYRGEWQNGQTYNVRDVVRAADGNAYYAESDGLTAEPPSAGWSLFVMQGAPGAPGAIGATGPQGNPGPTGPAGPQGIQGPVGPTGLQGPIGPQGPAGSGDPNAVTSPDQTIKHIIVLTKVEYDAIPVKDPLTQYNVTDDAGGGGGGGTSDHTQLTKRDASDQHPIAAISGLAARLSNIETAALHHLGYYADPTALTAAHPTADYGDYAIVASTDTVWVWNGSTWVDTNSQGDVTGIVLPSGAKTGQVTIDLLDFGVNSSASGLDDAVSKRHTHANKAILDSITAPVGDMLKSVYDTNNDGKVNSADVADALSGISNAAIQGAIDKAALIKTDGPATEFLNRAGDYSTPAGGGSGLPDGGTTGQVLKKLSNADQDAGWGNDKTQLVFTVPGPYAVTTTTTVLKSIAKTFYRWPFPAGKIKKISAVIASGTATGINVTINGVGVLGAALIPGVAVWTSSTALDYAVPQDAAFEITTAVSATASDLTVTIDIEG